MPAQDRVLVEIITSANMTGIREAQAGMLGMNSTTTAMIAGLGLAFVAGKSMVEISEKRQKADKDLAQAIKATGGNQQQANVFLQSYIETNRQYFSSQSDIVDAYASLTRSGLPAAEVQKDMNRALDLAAIKNVSVADATQLLIAAEHGRTRGLIDLGITTTKYTDAQGNVINQGKNMALVMAEVDAKTAHGRDTLTQTSQISNKLNNDWQDIAKVTGPPLIEAIDLVAGAVDWVVRELKALGENKDWANAMNTLWGEVDTEILAVIADVKDVIRLMQWVGSNLGNTHAGPSNINIKPHIRAAASGFEGIVNQPTLFLAGEGGSPEHVSIGSTGKGGGAASIHIHIDGIYAGDGPSLDILANKIALRLGYATGR